ncbi:hypothetical protein IID20_03920 [Patescibacteria group bacterium]|nr:hypothetical protein [Patescibacteria group bacterium]
MIGMKLSELTEEIISRIFEIYKEVGGLGSYSIRPDMVGIIQESIDQSGRKEWRLGSGKIWVCRDYVNLENDLQRSELIYFKLESFNFTYHCWPGGFSQKKKKMEDNFTQLVIEYLKEKKVAIEYQR